MRWLLVFGVLFALVAADEYLVRLKKPESLQRFLDSKILRKYSVKEYLGDSRIGRVFAFGSFKCLTLDLSSDIADRLRHNPFVAEIVPNIQIEAFKEEYEDDDDDGKVNPYTIQDAAPRHLARLSSTHQLPFDFRNEDEYNDFLKYYYSVEYQGTDTLAYIIDTGIYKENRDFENRVIHGIDLTGEGPGDFNGHGTHVAGIVGSKTFGVAKDVTLVEVKVLDSKGLGNLTSVLSGIEFAVNHCQTQSDENDKRCVANLSLGTIKNNIINEAINAATNSGLVTVVAAGNSNINACWTSPASAIEAITVGAFDDRTETIAFFSNWGTCVDIFASGVKVQSLSHLDSNKHISLSGTSMASPIVTGLVAILLDKGVKPYDIKDTIIDMSSKGIFNRLTLFFKYGTPNKVAFNGVMSKTFYEYEKILNHKEQEEEEWKYSNFLKNAIYPNINLNVLVDRLKNYKSKKFKGNLNSNGETRDFLDKIYFPIRIEHS